MDKINSILSELVQDRLLVDSMIDEEPMEQQFNHDPSLLEIEQELSPKEPKECVLPIISISPQHTPRRAKKLFLPSIPSYRKVPSFFDSLNTRPPIIFKPTYFVAELLRVVDYATLHGRKPLFEHLLYNNFVLFCFEYYLFFVLVFNSLGFVLFILGFSFCYFSFLFLFF